MDHASKSAVKTPESNTSAEINSVNAFMYGPTHSSVNTATDVDKKIPTLRSNIFFKEAIFLHERSNIF